VSPFRWVPWAPSPAGGRLVCGQDQCEASRRAPTGSGVLHGDYGAQHILALNQPKGSIAAFMLLMAIGTMTMYVYYATVYAAIQDVIEPRLRGTAVAIYSSPCTCWARVSAPLAWDVERPPCASSHA